MSLPSRTLPDAVSQAHDSFVIVGRNCFQHYDLMKNDEAKV